MYCASQILEDYNYDPNTFILQRNHLDCLTAENTYGIEMFWSAKGGDKARI